MSLSFNMVEEPSSSSSPCYKNKTKLVKKNRKLVMECRKWGCKGLSVILKKDIGFRLSFVLKSLSVG